MPGSKPSGGGAKPVGPAKPVNGGGTTYTNHLPEPVFGGNPPHRAAGSPERGPEPVFGGNPPHRAIGSFKHGGKVPKTGVYQLHVGEHVIPVSHAHIHAHGKAGNDITGAHGTFHHIKKGGFHKWLGKSPDAPITHEDIEKGLAAGGHAAKMANFANNAKHHFEKQ